MNRTVLLSLLILALLLAGASCGGGTGALQLDGARDVQGISEAGFNLVRYDDTGNATNAMNPTLDLAVQPAGDTTTVVIAIDDAQPTLGVTLDLRYDSELYTPQEVQFAGLIDTDVELAVMRLGGLVALGQVSTDGAGTRSGEFAVVTFRNEPNRSVSAAGDAHDMSIDTQYSANGFTADGFTAADDGSGNIEWNMLGIFTSRSGDGDQNGSSNIGDLTPLGAMLGESVSPTDAVSARADYDGNGLPNISDLTPLGANLGEITTEIEILAGDSEGSLALPAAVQATVTWNEGNPPVSPSTVTGNPQDVWQHWTGTIDAATADSIDADNDGFIFLSARALNGGAGADAVAFTPPLQVPVGEPPSNFLVESVTVEVNGVEVNDGDTVQLEANSTASFEVTGFDGKFNGADFDPGNLTTGPTQAEYDAELAAIREDFFAGLTQDLNPNGFAGFETDKADVLLNLTNADPDTATVFPDDDPGNVAEGRLGFAFARTNNTAADFSVLLDVTPDPNAPLIDDIRTGSGQDGDGDWIVTNTDPDIRGHLTFPGGDPSPIDGTTVDVELVDLTNDVVLPINFNFTAGPPSQAGEFTLLPAVTGYDFIIRTPPGTLNASNRYMVRFFSPPTENGSSVNQPGEFLTGGEVDAGFSSTLLPSNSFDSDTTKIVIIPADPVIRRSPQLDDQFAPVYGGYNDMLKDNGNEFSPSTVDGQTFPYVVVQQVNDPSGIQADAVQDGTYIQEETNPHRILVDILTLVTPPPATAQIWSYKVFGAPVVPGNLSSRPVITDGSFTINPAPGPGTPPLVGVNFGVNIFDNGGEGARDLANLNSSYYADKIIRISSLPPTFGGGGNDVDVLFVQFNGGRLDPVNPQGNPPEGFSNFSTQVVLYNDIQQGGPSKILDVRVAGVGTGSIDYIGLAHLLATDAGPSGLIGGFDYEVRLSDGVGPVYTFPTDMLSATN